METLEKLWEFFSGKKVAIGSLFLALAVILRDNFPDLIVWAGVAEQIGLILVGGGLAHKAVKASRE